MMRIRVCVCICVYYIHVYIYINVRDLNDFDSMANWVAAVGNWNAGWHVYVCVCITAIFVKSSATLQPRVRETI